MENVSIHKAVQEVKYTTARDVLIENIKTFLSPSKENND